MFTPPLETVIDGLPARIVWTSRWFGKQGVNLSRSASIQLGLGEWGIKVDDKFVDLDGDWRRWEEISQGQINSS